MSLKNLVVLIFADLAICCLSASAQTMDSNDASGMMKQARIQKREPPKRHFQSLSISYNLGNLYYDYHSDCSTKINGIGLTYTFANRISKIPLYVEYGGGLQYSFGPYCWPDNTIFMNPDGSFGIGMEIGGDGNLLSEKAIGRLLYRFDISGNFSIAPYAGISLESILTLKGPWNTFMFQANWHGGLRLDIHHFFISAFYESPIAHIAPKYCVKQVSISLGYTW